MFTYLVLILLYFHPFPSLPTFPPHPVLILRPLYCSSPSCLHTMAERLNWPDVSCPAVWVCMCWAHFLSAPMCWHPPLLPPSSMGLTLCRLSSFCQFPAARVRGNLNQRVSSSVSSAWMWNHPQGLVLEPGSLCEALAFLFAAWAGCRVQAVTRSCHICLREILGSTLSTCASFTAAGGGGGAVRAVYIHSFDVFQLVFLTLRVFTITWFCFCF